MPKSPPSKTVLYNAHDQALGVFDTVHDAARYCVPTIRLNCRIYAQMSFADFQGAPPLSSARPSSRPATTEAEFKQARVKLQECLQFLQREEYYAALICFIDGYAFLNKAASGPYFWIRNIPYNPVPA